MLVRRPLLGGPHLVDTRAQANLPQLPVLLACMSVPITSVVTDSGTTFWVNGQPYSYQWFNWRRFRTYLSTRYGLDDFWCWFYWLWFTVISEDGNLVFHNLTGEMHLLLIVLSRDLRVIQVQ